MAMNEGSVSISASGVASGSGLAKEIYDEMESETNFGTLLPPQQAVPKEQLAVLARAMAKVVPHIANNAVVTTTVGAGINVLVDTQSGAGATTGTGTGTGTVE